MLSADDIKSEVDRMWLDGHSIAIEDVETASSRYSSELKANEDMPKLKQEMELEFVKKYTDYLVKFLKRQNKMMLSTLLEDQ